MGCFNSVCNVTGLPITYDDEVAFCFVQQVQMPMYRFPCIYPDDIWTIVSPFAFGKYNDYGDVMDRQYTDFHYKSQKLLTRIWNRQSTQNDLDIDSERRPLEKNTDYNIFMCHKTAFDMIMETEFSCFGSDAARKLGFLESGEYMFQKDFEREKQLIKHHLSKPTSIIQSAKTYECSPLYSRSVSGLVLYDKDEEYIKSDEFVTAATQVNMMWEYFMSVNKFISPCAYGGQEIEFEQFDLSLEMQKRILENKKKDFYGDDE